MYQACFSIQKLPPFMRVGVLQYALRVLFFVVDDFTFNRFVFVFRFIVV